MKNRIMKTIVVVLSCILCVTALVGLLNIFNIGSSSDDNTKDELAFNDKVEEDGTVDDTLEGDKPFDFTTLSYVAYGSSTTSGDFVARSYPTIVSNTLGVTVTNRAVGGGVLATPYDSRHNMATCILQETESFDIISLMPGANDFCLDLPLGTIEDNTVDTFYGALNVVSEHLVENNPNALIIYMTPYHMYTGVNENGNYLDDYVEAVEIVAKKFNFVLIDFFSSETFDINDLKYFDLGHPTQYVYDNETAPAIVNVIREYYNK